MTVDQRQGQDRILVLGRFDGETAPPRNWALVAKAVLETHGYQATVQSRGINPDQLDVSERTAAILLDATGSRPREHGSGSVPLSGELVRGLREALRTKGLEIPILAASWNAEGLDFMRDTHRAGATDWVQMDLRPQVTWRNLIRDGTSPIRDRRK
jgi:hypothetical protein